MSRGAHRSDQRLRKLHSAHLREIKVTAITFALLSIPLTMSIVYQGGFRADQESPPVFHSQCEVFKKKMVHRWHHVETSCGEFRTSENQYRSMSTGVKYEIRSTPGNWARIPNIVEVAAH